MCNRTYPDFEEWVTRLQSRDDIVAALSQAFEQGYSAGYHDGNEHGWSDALDSDQGHIDGYYMMRHNANPKK